MITFEQAKQLQYGDVLIRNYEGRTQRWRVTGRVITWKMDSSRIRVPLKFGLYTYDRLTDADFDSNGHCHVFTRERDMVTNDG